MPPNPLIVLKGLRLVPSLLHLGGWFIVGHVVFNHGFHPGHITGISMMPTTNQDGDVVLVDKTKRRGKNVKVGDVVTFKHPVMQYPAIKRVVAMPGDFVLAGTPGAKGGLLAGQMLQVS